MDWRKRKKDRVGDFGGPFCPFLLLLALVTGQGWAGLGWAGMRFPFSWIDGKEDVCVSRLYLCVGNIPTNERTNERMHVLAPHHPLGEPLTTVCVEPPARSGGGGDMCGLPKVE